MVIDRMVSPGGLAQSTNTPLSNMAESLFATNSFSERRISSRRSSSVQMGDGRRSSDESFLGPSMNVSLIMHSNFKDSWNF